jgi:lipopolysaccharide/colanic/teichoic acid biosynthesis glycosyltransferase
VYANFFKRALDLLLSVVALPFVLLFCAAVAPLIHFEDKGPVFYNAPRVGRGGRLFKMYKLRSMRTDAPDLRMPDGSAYSAPDDPRMTRVGAFLRRTSLDELPQVLNILVGDMSVVGPRPDLEDETALYVGDEARKLEVRPGLTGYAQAYVRNSVPWKERLAYDVYYVDKISFSLDARIFFKTISMVLRREGIFSEE